MQLARNKNSLNHATALIPSSLLLLVIPHKCQRQNQFVHAPGHACFILGFVTDV